MCIYVSDPEPSHVAPFSLPPLPGIPPPPFPSKAMLGATDGSGAAAGTERHETVWAVAGGQEVRQALLSRLLSAGPARHDAWGAPSLPPLPAQPLVFAF